MSIVGSVSVRVVPSFTGMHRSIGRHFSGAGAEAGKTFSKSMGAAIDLRSIGGAVENVGQKISGVGGKLTKGITVPVAGAAAAVGGLVAALGFRRLVGLDTAQAKLRGLGYEAEAVERISGQVTDAIEGTMITMAEGVNIAAGAMAVGVAEGEDLEKYIRLVGDAAAASGRPVDEMAMIFNRVQGSGKLMTQELNMLEQAVPGVTQTLADSYGVSFEAFREMVTNGEVDAAHFREVMDEFMGGMGEEYANSFEGMTKNVLAYIGILGENLLSGAFPQMKEALADFIDFLASDDVAAWAQGVGESIGSAFSSAIEWVRSAIDWWTNLGSSTQKLIGWIVGIAVALGPVLVAIGTTITIVGKLIGTLAFLANPITWIVAGIAALVAGLTWFFTQTEIGQKIIEVSWSAIKTAISAVVGWITDTAWPAIQAAWDGITAGVQWLGETAQTVWGAISTAVEVAYTIIATIITAIVAVFLFLGTTMWNIWTNYIKLVWDTWVSVITWVWESILQPIFGFIASAFQALGTAFMWVWDNVIKPMWDMFVGLVRWVWESIIQPIFNFIVQSFKNVGTGFMVVWETLIKPVIDMVGAIIRWLWENVAEPYFGHISYSWEIMARWLRDVWQNTIRPMIEAFGDWVVNMWRNYIRPALGWISDKWGWLSGKISDFWNDGIKPTLEAFGNFFTDTIPGLVESGVEKIRDIWEGVKRLFREPINWVIRNVVNRGLIGAFNKVAGFIPGVSEISNVSEIGASSASGSRGNIPGYAEGGLADKGWAIVGEEGPELVNFSQPGRVYTADETQEMLGVGSPLLNISKKIATSDTAVGEWGRDAAGNVVQWARGALKSAVEAVLNPLFEPLKSWASGQGHVGEFAVGTAESVKDKLLSWAQSEDEKAAAEGVYDGPFTANPGGFNRPMQGPITSRAGRRSYWGAFGNMHYGVDIGGPIGTAVRAMFSGVIRAISGSGNNRTVVMNHGGYDTAYMHMSAITRAIGEQVSGGDIIARSGTAGSGPHGHFEYHPGGYYNPSIGAINALIRDKGGLLYPGVNQVLNDTGKAEYVFNQRQFDNLVAATESGGQVSSGGDTYYVQGDLDQAYKIGQEVRFIKRSASRRRVGV